MNVYVQVNHQLLKMLKVYCIHVSFDPKRYDLASVGRYKTNKKLHLKASFIQSKIS